MLRIQTFKCVHACTKTNYQIIWFGGGSIESVMRRKGDLWGRNQPSSSPSVRVLRSILPVPTHRPVDGLRPTAQLNATTCYPRVSAHASLGLISSDKPNISGEFTPLGLTCRLTSNYAADVSCFSNSQQQMQEILRVKANEYGIL